MDILNVLSHYMLCTNLSEAQTNRPLTLDFCVAPYYFGVRQNVKKHIIVIMHFYCILIAFIPMN